MALLYACCRVAVVNTDVPMICISCSGYYHLQCVSASSRKDPTLRNGSDWTCPACLSKQPKTVKNDSTPVRMSARKQCDTESVNVTLRNKNSKNKSPTTPSVSVIEKSIDSSCDLRGFIRQEISELKRDLEFSFKNFINSELKIIKDEVQEIKMSIAFINNKYDEMKERFEIYDKCLVSVNSLSNEIGIIKSSLAKLEHESNIRDQWARRSNIEICGIPEKKNENLFDIIEKISQHVNFSFNKSDIDFLSRVAPSTKDPKKPKPIIVRFLSRYNKDDFLCKTKKLKSLKASDLGFSGTESLVFFNDHLTSLNKSLLRQVKIKAKDNNYRFVWVKNCSIMVRKSESSPIFHINNMVDLLKIK
ncbi:unnamed protein product [Parnassius mnemosyne]|uniref:FP protein C-terminal domain-containing protein n=1 Tax=Parnassius mnemosyne TaxID=213953 RepID=A0AAV1LHN7_9NEOP